MSVGSHTFEELDRAIAGASPSDRAGLVVALAARLATLGAGLTAPPPGPVAAAVENIDVTEAARRLGMSPRWVYRNAKSLPFMVRLGRRQLCNAAKLESYIQRQTGAR